MVCGGGIYCVVWTYDEIRATPQKLIKRGGWSGYWV